MIDWIELGIRTGFVTLVAILAASILVLVGLICWVGIRRYILHYHELARGPTSRLSRGGPEDTWEMTAEVQKEAMPASEDTDGETLGEEDAIDTADAVEAWFSRELTNKDRS